MQTTTNRQLVRKPLERNQRERFPLPTMKVRIKYVNPEMPLLEQHGDWIDLRTAEEYPIILNEPIYVSFGICVELPPNFEALIAPRSSLFKEFGCILTNSIGIIDNAYKGDEDVWRAILLPIWLTEKKVIPKYTRICQFRILVNQPNIEFEIVNTLNNPSRGGYGSTGLK